MFDTYNSSDEEEDDKNEPTTTTTVQKSITTTNLVNKSTITTNKTNNNNNENKRNITSLYDHKDNTNDYGDAIQRKRLNTQQQTQSSSSISSYLPQPKANEQHLKELQQKHKDLLKPSSNTSSTPSSTIPKTTTTTTTTKTTPLTANEQKFINNPLIPTALRKNLMAKKKASTATTSSKPSSPSSVSTKQQESKNELEKDGEDKEEENDLFFSFDDPKQQDLDQHVNTVQQLEQPTEQEEQVTDQYPPQYEWTEEQEMEYWNQQSLLQQQQQQQQQQQSEPYIKGGENPYLKNLLIKQKGIVEINQQSLLEEDQYKIKVLREKEMELAKQGIGRSSSKISASQRAKHQWTSLIADFHTKKESDAKKLVEQQFQTHKY